MVRLPPEPPQLGTHDGLAYALFMPASEPAAAVVVIHGAGSAKESHFDFGRAARDLGFAALAYDQRGHGSSDGEFGPAAIDDALAMARLAGEHAPAVAFRGSSLGGFCAIHAAARLGDSAAVVAICPPTEEILLRGLRNDTLEGFRCDLPACERWLEGSDVTEAAASLAPRTALLLMHARGDDQVPYTVSEQIHAAAGEPKRLLVFPGGHHRSIQHDGELQGESLRFIRKALRAG